MRLNQVTAAASDLEASIAFYQLLGLKLIVKSPHYARFELPRGEATFSLHVVEGAVPRENAPQLYFEVEDVEFETRRLKHAGVAIEREPAQQSWLWHEAWLRDPAGNAVCLFHAGENRRYPPWRIDMPEGAKNMHLVIRDGETWSVVKFDGGQDDWQALQERYRDYITSLGPFDLFSLLAMLEREWPELFLASEQKLRAFAVSDETETPL
ncbi:MAG TPA: VOC family protein [Vitreimonas sp.]|nr:VOC family protein [Vitreimonas sp.]